MVEYIEVLGETVPVIDTSNLTPQGKLLALALNDNEIRPQVIGMPIETFEDIHHVFVDYLRQLETDKTSPTLESFKGMMDRKGIIPFEIGQKCGIWHKFNRAASRLSKNDVPELLRQIERVEKRKKGIELAKAENIADAAPLLLETGVDKAKIDRAKKAIVEKKRKNSGKLKIACMAGIAEKPMEWLWDKIIPLGGLTIIAGEGEGGKSTVVSDFAARVTNGEKWPDGSIGCKPSEVLYVGVEEDVERVLRRRLRLFGADLTKIHYAPGIIDIDDEGREIIIPWRFEDILQLRETLIKNPNIKLVIFDPIGTLFGVTDARANAEVYRLLEPLSKLGQELGVTMLGIHHIGKDEKRSLKNRILDSVAIVNASRTVIGIIRDKAKQTSYLGVCKSNFNSKRGSVPFTIGDDKISWGTEIEQDIDALLKTITGDVGRGSVDKELAKQIIKNELENGPKPSGPIKAKLVALGVSEPTTKRAAEELGVISERGKSFGAGTTWNLPQPF